MQRSLSYLTVKHLWNVNFTQDFTYFYIFLGIGNFHVMKVSSNFIFQPNLYHWSRFFIPYRSSRQIIKCTKRSIYPWGCVFFLNVLWILYGPILTWYISIFFTSNLTCLLNKFNTVFYVSSVFRQHLRCLTVVHILSCCCTYKLLY